MCFLLKTNRIPCYVAAGAFLCSIEGVVYPKSFLFYKDSSFQTRPIATGIVFYLMKCSSYSLCLYTWLSLSLATLASSFLLFCVYFCHYFSSSVFLCLSIYLSFFCICPSFSLSLWFLTLFRLCISSYNVMQSDGNSLKIDNSRKAISSELLI